MNYHVVLMYLSNGMHRIDHEWLRVKRIAVRLMFVTGLLALACINAHAATVNANQTSDVVNGDTSSVANLIASDGGDGISLREAIIATNNTFGADTIILSFGNYNLSIAGTGEDLSVTGDLDITDALTITGASISATIIDGNLLDRVFEIRDFISVSMSDLTIRRGSFDDKGGGILNEGYLSLTDVNVLNNDAKHGGGIYSLKDSSLTITGGSIGNNTADEDGGGIHVKDSSIGAIITNVTIRSNSATNGGGGMFIEASALTITGTTFNGNSAEEGGGLYNKKGSTQTLTNNTLSGNSATSLGGSIFAEGGNLSLTNITITNNSAPQGSGLHVKSGSPALLNVIVAGNTGSAEVDGNVSSLGTNLIGNSSGSGGWIGSDILNVLPLLGSLTNNGGPTRTHALLLGSRGIDEGNNSGAPAFDQRGVLRDATVDIGAYEFDTPPVPEMDVSGLGVSIADGDATPSTTDDTDFGSHDISTGSNANTFTVTNTGSAVLNLTGTPRVTIGGAHGADFTLTVDAATTVASGGGTTTFTITFDPSAVGLRTATVSIANDDADENPYNFSIQGTGTIPEMDVTKSPDVASVNNAGDVITYTITLTNTGVVTITSILVSDPLLSSISCVPGSGPNPNDLAPAAVATCTGTYAATQADFDTNGGGDGDIDNTVTVTADDGLNETDNAAVILNIAPTLAVGKTADDTTDVVVGQVITYTYVVSNTGNQTITNVLLSELHGGSGPPPVPSNETLTTDNPPLGDSTDAVIDGVWDTIAPGDIVTFTGTYTVTQSDVDLLQ